MSFRALMDANPDEAVRRFRKAVAYFAMQEAIKLIERGETRAASELLTAALPYSA